MSGVTWAVNAAARTGEGELGDYHAELSPVGTSAVEVRLRDGDGELVKYFVATSVVEAQRAAERRLARLVEEDIGATDEDIAATLAAIKARRS